MREIHTVRIAPAQLLSVSVDPQSGESTIAMLLEDGHELQVILGPGALQRLYQHIVHEQHEGRVVLPPQTATP